MCITHKSNGLCVAPGYGTALRPRPLAFHLPYCTVYITKIFNITGVGSPCKGGRPVIVSSLATVELATNDGAHRAARPVPASGPGRLHHWQRYRPDKAQDSLRQHPTLETARPASSLPQGQGAQGQHVQELRVRLAG